MSTFTAHIVAHRHTLPPATISAAAVVCQVGGGGGGGGGGKEGGGRQTGQIFNNCIFEDTIKFSLALF